MEAHLQDRMSQKKKAEPPVEAPIVMAPPPAPEPEITLAAPEPSPETPVPEASPPAGEAGVLTQAEVEKLLNG
jgi:hypothetical protein